MTRIAISLGMAVFLTTGLAAGAPAAKGKAKASKGGAAKTSDEGAPSGSGAEMDKLKGDFKWSMSSDDVVAKVQDRIRANYEERLQKTAQDPSRQDRVRKDMTAELERVKGKLVKFDGQKTGYDVSIIDQEFLHGVNESMLMAKEESSTRYFFFTNDRLYKMFIAFDKEMLQGKSFREFGQLMQAQFGKAKEVDVEERSKAGVKLKLDHFVWSSKSGDMLRLVDRSEFYDVYCLVIYDGKVARQQDEIRQSRRTGPKRDSLVESVTSAPVNDRDAHDNIVDQITGKQVGKPGEKRGNDIVVPRVTPANVRGPTPAEVNRKSSDEEESPKPAKRGKQKESTPKSETEGLAL